jgi:Pyridoxamine 5'-phosphate oxidase
MIGPVTVPDWPPGTVAILTTVAADGAPHAIPVSTALRTGRRTVMLALAPSRGSLERMKADPRCTLAVLAEGVAITLRGHASVAGDAAGTVAVRLDVSAIDDHDRPTFAIEAGVGWRWTDAQAERRDAEVRAALHEISTRR